ncbi:MAG TPA: nucleotidyltransferase family protein [Gemmatimonadaceae bacterium]|nr:nucleotidyltransferase family protein [Gemmatimonadaceae bacterium]
MSNSATKTDREVKLAILLSRVPLDTPMIDEARRLAEQGVEWKEVANFATRLLIEPAVFGNLRTFFSEEIDPELLKDFTRRDYFARATALTQTVRVLESYRSMTAAGIDALVLKGPATSVTGYDNPSLRYFSDIDLVIKRVDLAAAQAHLESRGYKPLFDSQSRESLITGQHALEFEGSGPPVELHWALLPRHLKFDLTPEALWNEAVTIESSGTEFKALAAHHLFLYLCAHGAKHAWNSYRWVCDVAQLARRLTAAEAEKVIALAERTHTKRIVALALRIVRETFGEEPSPFSRDAFGEDRQVKSLVLMARAGFDPSLEGHPILPRRLARLHPYAEPLTFWIRSRERLRDRVTAAARFVFEPAPGDRPKGAANMVLRPARMVRNALRSAVRPRD